MAWWFKYYFRSWSRRVLRRRLCEHDFFFSRLLLLLIFFVILFSEIVLCQVHSPQLFLKSKWQIRKSKSFIPLEFFSYFKDSLNDDYMNIANPNEEFLDSDFKHFNCNNYRLLFLAFDKERIKYIIALERQKVPYSLYQIYFFNYNFELNAIYNLFAINITEIEIKNLRFLRKAVRSKKYQHFKLFCFPPR
jgi:hypothetical protein